MTFISFFVFLFVTFGAGYAEEVIYHHSTEKVCGKYLIKIYEKGTESVPLCREGRLEIYKEGKLLFKDEKQTYRIGLMYEDMPEAPLVNECRDITGQGKPNLVVSTYSGGAHCCFGFKVFELGSQLKLLDEIDASESDLAKFQDLDNDGVLEFVGRDWTFAYWNTNFSDSPAPQINLRFKNGKYRLALDLMKKPKPTDNEINEELKRTAQARQEILERKNETINKGENFDTEVFCWMKYDVIVPPVTWGYMLDLIYSGNTQSAWQFLDKVWPEGKPGKNEFLGEFKKQLGQSRYWNGLKKNLKG